MTQEGQAAVAVSLNPLVRTVGRLVATGSVRMGRRGPDGRLWAAGGDVTFSQTEYLCRGSQPASALRTYSAPLSARCLSRPRGPAPLPSSSPARSLLETQPHHTLRSRSPHASRLTWLSVGSVVSLVAYTLSRVVGRAVVSLDALHRTPLYPVGPCRMSNCLASSLKGRARARPWFPPPPARGLCAAAHVL